MTLKINSKLPSCWKRVANFGPKTACFKHAERSLFVMVDVTKKADGKNWLHLSMSKATETPDHYDVREVKEAFIPNLVALQIFPSLDKYVNIHKHCLHLWACEDQSMIPEMSQILDGVGRSI